MVKAADKQYDPVALESRVRARWKAADAYKVTRASREKSGKDWYFIDGPPYATGHIHLGTARNKVIKDSVLRYMTMRGFNVRDQPGYDMHGLPIEVKVEKELGFSTKRDIDEYGIEEFVNRCRRFAMDHMQMMNAEFEELGVWMNWEKPYLTLDNSYVEAAWWALAKAHERNLLFESERVLTWCWRCETPLANAEVEFEDRVDASIYVKFPVEDRPGEFLLIWTTTPWTLPANVAIAANPRLEYVRLRGRRPDGKEEVVYVVSDQAQHVAGLAGYSTYDILSRVHGADLEGLRYEHPFALEVGYHREPKSDWNNRVILGEHVLGDRTGLVHTATGHGVDDFTVGKQYGIPVFSPVGEDGRYTTLAGALQGLRVKGAKTSEEDADSVVQNALRAKGLLLSAGKESHSYGHCWRCKNPIVYRSTTQWFIDVGAIQDRMLSEVGRVQWTPEWAGSARQMEWVRNARDWCVSRQRYWGIPLPVWRCKHCDETHVVHSTSELKALSPNYEDGMDLHRPWIDRVFLACRCGGRMTRIPDVLDVWFDSAVAAWGGLEYPRNTVDFDRWFPGDFICEGLDQTRGWFYSQLGAGVASFGRIPYESVLMHGWVHDEHGRPMSKSLGNVVQPKEVIRKVGADALRFNILAAAAPWDDLSFSVESARNTSRTFNILWNVHVFATQYMAMDGFDADAVTFASVEPHLTAEDRWLYSRLQALTDAVTRGFEAKDLHRATRELDRFILDDLSRWYVRLVRDRVWAETPDAEAGKRAAYRALHDALSVTARLLAPVAPYLSDAVWEDLTEGAKGVTVHMADWPVPDPALRDVDLERDMAVARDLVEAAANSRHKANMKLRWPVRKIVVAGPPTTGAAVERLRGIIEAQTNAKSIEFVGTEWEGLALVAEPVKNLVGPAFKQDAGRVMQAVREADGRSLSAALDAEGTATVGPYSVTKDMVRFEARIPEHVLGADFAGGSLYIDTEVDDAIRAEGLARDLVRRVQEMRKEMKLEVNALIEVQASAPEEMTRLVRTRATEIARDVRASRFGFVESPEGEHVREWDLEGDQVRIGISPAPAGSRIPQMGRERFVSAAQADATSAAPLSPPRAAAKRAPPKQATFDELAGRRTRGAAPLETPTTGQAPPRNAPRKKASAKKAAGKKAAAKKATKKAAKTSAKKGTGKKAAAKKATRRTPAKKAAKKPTKKASAKKSTKKASKKSTKKGGRSRS